MGVVDDLRKVPLFEGLAEEELSSLAEVAFAKVYQKGELICEKGAPGEALYVIRVGKVRIFTPTKKRNVKLFTGDPSDSVKNLVDGLKKRGAI